MTSRRVLALVDAAHHRPPARLPRRAARERARAQPGARRRTGRARPVMARERAPPTSDSPAHASQARAPQDLPRLRPRRRQDVHHARPRRIGACRAARTSSSASWRRTVGRRSPSWPRACPVVSRKHVEYRGKVFEEMDTAAVIARQPEWVLVDELAHTNVPGAAAREALAERRGDPRGRHQRDLDGQRAALREPERHRVRDHRRARARDAARLRARRGRRGRARRPHDRCPAQPPEARRRLRPRQDPRRAEQLLPPGQPRGAARARPAQDGRGGRRVARELHRRARDRAALGHGGARRRLRQARLRSAKKLVRRGLPARQAPPGPASGCVHVHTPGETLGAHQSTSCDELFELARELGGEVVGARAATPRPRSILEFARENRATFIVMGQSKRSRLDEVCAAPRSSPGSCARPTTSTCWWWPIPSKARRTSRPRRA